jgi:hypothetical protein
MTTMDLFVSWSVIVEGIVEVPGAQWLPMAGLHPVDASTSALMTGSYASTIDRRPIPAPPKARAGTTYGVVNSSALIPVSQRVTAV